MSGTLSREQIQHLLSEVAEEAVRREVTVSLFLVGGAAMSLAYSTDRSTSDLDGVFEPKEVVYSIGRAIARKHPELELPEDWLNDAAKAFMPGADPNATTYMDLPGLTVSIASPRYLFVMKAMAGRESDLSDLELLYSLSGFADVDDALATVESAYKHQRIKSSSTL